MENFILISSVILGFLGILISIWRPGNNGMKVATWVMWLVMDVMALTATIAASENPALLWLFVICTVLVVISLLYKRQYGWSWVETLTAVLMVICVIIMFTASDPKIVVWANSLALFIGGIPILRDFTKIQNPDKLLIMSGCSFLVGMIVALIMAIDAGEMWILPGQGFVFWVIALVILFTRPKDAVVAA